MSAGEFIDGLLARFVVHVVLVFGLATVVAVGIDPLLRERPLLVGAAILMPGVGWAFGVAFGRRQVYRRIGRSREE